MTILVTGATGTVGRHLVTQLLADGHKVRALTRTPERAALPAGAEVVGGDLTDTASLAAAFEGVHAAHLITFGGADFAPLTNGEEIADLARRSGIRGVTLLKGDVAKSPLEEAIAAGGLGWTGLAPVEFMSNTLEWADTVRTEGVVREAFPDAKSALIHEADIAAVAATLLTTESHAGQEHWLTGPEALTVPQQVSILGKALGRELRYVELSTDEIVAQWRATGFSDEDIDFFLTMRTNPPHGEPRPLPTVEDLTGTPPRTFTTWAHEHADVFRA
ncbi:NmrA family NAD(P)-binding protein [Streptomyces iconiensis]|uniref:NmrA family NAD(P)-binding protein n=1 Tax=Streptomyces iconiensis TaxID=1384038 RepID=A0ABT7A6U1_9ACTN|nr:NmrA family NAD(P)-binding protein [Streptomyces iconiensis]MDJ1137048.1 NmrA family NAD(P)-binding protein [Streptomyces iconiensis]